MQSKTGALAAPSAGTPAHESPAGGEHGKPWAEFPRRSCAWRRAPAREHKPASERPGLGERQRPHRHPCAGPTFPPGAALPRPRQARSPRGRPYDGGLEPRGHRSPRPPLWKVTRTPRARRRVPCSTGEGRAHNGALTHWPRARTTGPPAPQGQGGSGLRTCRTSHPQSPHEAQGCGLPKAVCGVDGPSWAGGLIPGTVAAHGSQSPGSLGMAEEGGRWACGGNSIGAVTRTPVGVLGGGPAHRMRAGHAPSPAARSPMRREDATRSPKQPRLRWGLGPRRPRAAGSPVRSPVRGSRPPATHTGGRGPVCSGRAGGLGTHVQLHQGEQVLLGGSEDGICLPAGDGLGSIALRVVADHRGRICDGHALLGLERNTGGVTGGTGGGVGTAVRGGAGAAHLARHGAPRALVCVQEDPGAVAGHPGV